MRRFKTLKEFEAEYPHEAYRHKFPSWTNQMDYLFGQPIDESIVIAREPYETIGACVDFEYGQWNICNWMA